MHPNSGRHIPSICEENGNSIISLAASEQDGVKYQQLISLAKKLGFLSKVINAKDKSAPIVHHAILRGDKLVTKRLLGSGADLKGHHWSDNSTAFHTAGWVGDKELLELVWNYGGNSLDINDLDYYGNTALHMAAESASRVGLTRAEKMVDFLLEKGADPDLANFSGETYDYILDSCELPEGVDIIG